MDIHRVFAEAVMLDDGKVDPAGPRRHDAATTSRRSPGTLTHDDHVVVEATGNAAAVVGGGRAARRARGDRQPAPGAADRARQDQDRRIDATVLAKLYASNFLPEVWVPDARTLALRRQVTRRNQIVRQRVRLKTTVQSILHAHLVPPCPHADLFGGRGRAWLAGPAAARPTSGTPSSGTCASTTGSARTCGSWSASWRATPWRRRRQAADDHPGHRHGGGDRPRGGHRRRSPASTGRTSSSSYLGLNPSVRQSGEGPRPARAHHQAGPLPRPDHAGRGRLVRRCAAPVRCGPSSCASPAGAATTSRPSRSPASWRSSSGTCCSKGEDYAGVRPALHARKLRGPRAHAPGRPARRGQRGGARVRVQSHPPPAQEERRRAEQAEAAYRRHTEGWRPKRGRRAPMGAAKEERP